MKRILALTLTASIAVSFASCGKKDAANGKTDEHLTGAQENITVPQDPADYLEYIILDNNNIPENINKTFNILKNGQNSTSSECEIKLTVGEGAFGFMEAVFEDDAEDIYSNISWLKNASLAFDYNIENKDLLKLVAKLGLNDTHIVSADITASEANEELYLSIPELTDKTIMVSVPEYLTEQIFGSRLTYLPDGDTAERILTKYTAIIIDELSDKIELSDEKITVNGVSSDVKMVYIEFDNQDAINVSEAVLERATNDDDIKALIAAFAEENYVHTDYESPEEMTEATIESMKESLDEIRNTEPTSDDVCDIVFYTDKKTNAIAGFEFIDYAQETSLVYRYAENGGKFAMEFCINDYTVIDGNGQISGNNLTGVLDISDTQGNSIATVNINSLDKDAMKNGLLKCKLSAKLADSLIENSSAYDILSDSVFELEFNQISDTEYTTEFSYIYADKKVATLGAKAENKAAEAITIPTDTISAEDSDAMKQMLQNLNLAKLLENLTNAGATPLLSMLPFDMLG